MNDLDAVILDSIWERILWDFLLQHPQLEEWLDGSKLEATDDPNVFRLTVKDTAPVDWLEAHIFAIQFSLSVEMKRPVVVRVVAMAVTA